MPASLPILLVALVVALLPTGTPEQTALVAVTPARALVAERLAHFARHPVHLEDVLWTELVVAGAELRKVALMFRQSAHVARRLWFAGFEVAALSSGAGGVRMESAGGRVAARVVAVLLQPAVALLTGLHKAVAADRALKQSSGLVPEAVVHAVLKGEGEVLQAAG